MGFAICDMQLSSPAFRNGGAIPRRHAGDGEDLSPALQWRDAPDGTRGFALICHDPDAPLIKPGSYGFVHWVLYGIPGEVQALAEATTDYVSGGNDFGKQKYGGPMPPPGHGTHHYFFWLFALRSLPRLEPGLTMWKLLEKIEPEVIGMNRLLGTYVRS